MGFFDAHRHDMFSTFDGFGKPSELAMLAKELGHSALSTTNHGNTNGLIQTYKACKEAEVKAILGVEGYMLPAYKPQDRGYHFCVYAKSLEGYRSINALQYDGEKQKYYNPIWDLKLLEKHREGLICSSACIASYSSQCILKGEYAKAERFLSKVKEIFGGDFYIEIQPYKVSDVGMQEKINTELIKMGKKLGIRCILTSDSHRGRKEDFDTYLKMHQMKGDKEEWVRGTYLERYMPTEEEIKQRFVDLHSSDYGKQTAIRMANKMVDNLSEFDEKVEDDILDGLQLQLPKIAGADSEGEIVRLVKQGLKERGKLRKDYVARCKEELKVIKANGFIDYFLIVADYAKWAKENEIPVGPGRGSVCNSLVAYAMYITEVDSLRFNLDFRRFMRTDKKAYPDIDLDFATDGRDRVIEYLITKYEGHAARVASYGLYKVDNTLNDLAKVCGLGIDKETDEGTKAANKEVIAEAKRIVNSYLDDSGELMKNEFEKDPTVKQYNKQYDNIFAHFEKLYNKIRYVGTHAAGVVLTSGDILQYTSLRLDKSGSIYASYNLEDLNDINILKFDLLGLKTMQSIGECRKLAGRVGFDDSIVDDPELMKEFGAGNTDGIFQLEKSTAKGILEEIQCDCFDDIMATNALNRPGPLKQGMHELYAANKANVEGAKTNRFYQFAKESYGTVIYQEQLMLICVNIGGYTWPEADRMLKITKHGKETALKALEKEKTQGNDYKAKFFENAKKFGLKNEEIDDLWESMLVYSFNKGHAAGYSLISVEEMFYKHYYPTYFWYVKVKYAGSDKDRERFCNKAAKDGAVIFLPHVNYSKIGTSIRKVEGEPVLQKGLSDLKDIGEKAAATIVEERKKNGIFTSFDDFYDRCKSRLVTARVVRVLQEQGALDFDKKRYLKKVVTYNSSLISRA